MPIAFGSQTTATLNAGGTPTATMTLNVPAGVADGDMLLAAIIVGESAGVSPTIPGWTLKRSHNGIQDGQPTYDWDLTTALFWRRASSEPASYTVTPDGTYGNWVAGAMLRYTGVISTGDPFRTINSVSRTNAYASPVSSVALTGVLTTDMAVHVTGTSLGNWNTDTYDMAGPGGGWTERGEVYQSAATSAKSGCLCLEQLGTGTAPSVTFSGTAATASNLRSVFVAGALMPEPDAVPAGPRVISTAVRRASTW